MIPMPEVSTGGRGMLGRRVNGHGDEHGDDHGDAIADDGGRHQRVETGHQKSLVVKRSLVVGGHKTSVSLEEVFWQELRAIAQRRRMPLSQLVGNIDSAREHCNLSSAIRLFVFEQCRAHPQEAEPELAPNGASPMRRDIAPPRA